MYKLTTILFVIISGILAYTTYSYKDQYDLVKEERDVLKIEISNLEEDKKNLNAKVKDLEDVLKSLGKEVEVLERKVSGEQSLYRVNDRLTQRNSNASNNIIETKIDGTFNGWNGESIFKMKNGSVWQQASYAYQYHYAYNPDVTIYLKDGKNYMKVEGVNEALHVKRIK